MLIDAFVLARSVNDVQSAVERIFPLVYEFRKPRTPADEELLRAKRARQQGLAPYPAPPAPPVAPAPAPHLLTLSDDEAESGRRAWQ